MVLKLICPPQRYVFAVVGFFITLVGYMMRISVNVTMAYMINQTVVTTPQEYDPHSCPGVTVLSNQTDSPSSQHLNTGIFDWDAATQKSLSTAFSTSFIMSQFIAGVIADTKGAKKILTIAFIVFSISTFVIPFASKVMGSTAVYVLRFISGMASGTIVPALISMMSKWVPKHEQAFIASIIFPGSLIGYVAGSWFGDLMADTIGWEYVYYTFGMFGLVCSFIWIKLVFSTPNNHPTISETEKRYLNDNLPSLQRTKKYDLDPLPWKALLRCGALWGILVGNVGREWSFYVFTNLIPQFMSDVLRLDITFSSYLVFTPYVLMWITALLFGLICDNITKRGYCSVKNARRLFTGIGIVTSIFCITMMMYTGCSQTMALFWLFTGMAGLGAFYSGCMIGALDITPNYAGSTIAVVNTLAYNSTNIVPSITKIIVSGALLQQWRILLWIVVFLLVISIAVYITYVQDQHMWWDDVRKFSYPAEWKHGLLSCEGEIDENGRSIFKDRKDSESES